MKEISTRQLFEVYQRQSVFRIIDCREINEFEEYHIKDTINVPFDILCDKPNLFLNKLYEYYIICKNDSRSKLACYILNQKGYKVINVIGGVDAWPGLFTKSVRYSIK